MEEKVILDKGKVCVSNNKFVVDDQSYDMAAIKSVKTTVTKGNKLPGVVIGFAGLMIMLAAKQLIIGLAVAAAGIYLAINAKDRFSVVLSTESGDDNALTSNNREHIESIVAALNESILSRVYN
ncbi:DUF6232 family protein [Aliagarivorans marinus]|uniref:DUF6232 family protein n=1 Tax=Aliagarivorans marinus TaxID=561965 RepID=UPI000411D8B6|nr:DUF6232 family protein [Aliagarivorans marinus]